MSRAQADAVALARDSDPPPDVVVHHCQSGIGSAMIDHRVELKDNRTGALLANYPAGQAALWLKEHGYHYVPGTNGLWQI